MAETKVKQAEEVKPAEVEKKNSNMTIILVVVFLIVGLCGLCALCGAIPFALEALGI